MSDPHRLAELPDPLPVAPATGPLDADVVLPGSKSITNRALVAAALAEGTSVLRGVLDADDTRAMIDGVRALGAEVTPGGSPDELVVVGLGGAPAPGARDVHARLSGTTSRFLLPVLALAEGPSVLDGGPPLRARPMADGIAAVRSLGARVVERGAAGHLPVEVAGGPAALLPGAQLAVPGDASSQFLSGLLLAGPCLPGGVTLRVVGALVSRPYVEMTLAVLRAFGAEAAWRTDDELVVAPGGYRAARYDVEPDASAASYAFAAAAVCGGRVRVAGLGAGALQGDVAFVDVLERMGATVRRSADAIEVEVGEARLRGISVDLGALSDTAQTLAAVAPFAEGPTEVTGIGFIRAKETDRIGAVVTELRRLGVDAEERPDGFVIRPGPISPGVVRTYDDHRMAMAFAVLGLGAPGVAIAEPACVAKTFPGFWSWLEDLRSGARGR